ncbi:hypothetical protein GCM10027280_05190 [Micromonospora polyrhachis]|uniref:Uncharacterized protein n=1 Tax=Micromonospora polyrhachis TaxID=1282883 RepID=A0A7W7SKZ1_9ACTN|nr:hypothetical protein [Micromonospora polyrhachis]MBB4956571.1 hypothetical protein [Micromonospora polyrhachis]
MTADASRRHATGTATEELIDQTGREFGIFSAGTYGGMFGEHASGGFKGRFRSLDMYPESAKTAAYFTKDVAFRFSEAIDTAAGKLGFTYQILYDDYVVAREFNARAQAGKGAEHGRMGNQDNVTEEEVQLPDGTKVKRPGNLSWHGPLVTHFHVDFSSPYDADDDSAE